VKHDRQDVYTRVTAQIIAELEKGVRPWLKPWNAEHMAGKVACPLRFNGQPYKGVNVVMLWASAAAQGFSAPTWMTFNQAGELGAHVKKGERGSLVVYADSITRTETGDDGKEIERDVFFMKGYTVFNAEQIEGLPAHYYAAATPPLDPERRIEAADSYFANTKATIRHGGNMAYYSPGADYVQMPPYPAFKDAESYYATLAHEVTHWTRHPDRLDRDFGRRRFGDEGYAREELVAEIGSAFLCCELGLTPEPREDHAAYLGHWLKVLKADNRAIFQAATHAQKAADYLHGLQPEIAHSPANDRHAIEHGEEAKPPRFRSPSEIAADARGNAYAQDNGNGPVPGEAGRVNLRTPAEIAAAARGGPEVPEHDNDNGIER
jgi:antirestriction protein ArdC